MTTPKEHAEVLREIARVERMLGGSYHNPADEGARWRFAQADAAEAGASALDAQEAAKERLAALEAVAEAAKAAKASIQAHEATCARLRIVHDRRGVRVAQACDCWQATLTAALARLAAAPTEAA